MTPSQIDTADLYNERLTADFAAMRVLVDQTVRRIFAQNFANAGSLRRTQIAGAAPAANGRADVRTITSFNLRQSLLHYLVNTGRLITDGDETVRIAPGLVVCPEEQDQARHLVAADSRFAEMAEVLSALEQHGQKLLQGEDGAKVLAGAFGFKRMQSIWERQALHMPQRFVDRTLGAKMLLERIRAQPSGMTVLECGAGIGSVLRRALELPGFLDRLHVLQRYLYTDISPFLIEWSKDWFRRNAPEELTRRMEFKVLDLDAVQASKACAPGSVDLVLLDDVAHDVVDLHRTLMELRTVLHENGWLALTESFRQPPQDFLHLEVFAMTLHGYNKARLEPGRREHHGFMTLDEWRRSLHDAGFADLHVYPDPVHHARWPNGGILAARGAHA